MRERRVSENSLTRDYYSVTLGMFQRFPEGKVEPPWAQPQFSFRFSGVPPVECYDEMIARRLNDDCLEPHGFR